MKNITGSAAFTAVALTLATQTAFAENMVGYNRVPVLAASDTRISVPFSMNAEAELTVDSVAGDVVTVSGGGLTAGAYDGGGFYIRLVGGAGEGLWTTITSNNGTTITVEDAAVAAFAANGDAFRVVRHHTLGSMLPASLLGVAFNGSTQVLVYDNDLGSIAQNRSAAQVAFNFGGTWVGGGVSNGTVLEPETQFVLRNNSGDDLAMVTFGEVPEYSVSFLIAPNGDLNIGSGYPVPVTLGESGLEGEGREVLFFDNGASGPAGLNPSASKVAFSFGTNWFGAGVSVGDKILPSETISLRLSSSEAASKVTIPRPY